MTVPYIPLSPAFLACSTQEVVFDQTEFLLNPKATGNGRDITQTNITNDMIPPALSKMRKDMLPRELLKFVKDMPKMKNWKITNNK